MQHLIIIIISFFAFLAALPTILGILRLFGVYAIVHEGTCQVYVLWGAVAAVLDQPGFYFLPFHIFWRAPIINFFGQVTTVDMRLDQHYLRSQAVNSEEGAPMGIGVWYEMFVNDPVAFLFKNSDPRGSLRANVSNAAVRCLSNMKLAEMLENRHTMSLSVRSEVTPKSNEWGYGLGSVYVRKVHLRDRQMIAQIEAKVVNRLRQVTSAIKQDGANQVSIITNTAEKQAAVEFARAAAIRPQVVGEALERIASDKEVSDGMFQALEYQRLAQGSAKVTLLSEGAGVLGDLIASRAK